MHILIKNKYLFINKYKAKCAVGKRGIGVKRKEGDFITPKGEYKIKFILYRKDRVKKLQSVLKKFPINKKMGWCNDPKSHKYNKLIKYPFKFSSEKLFRKDNVYDIILVLNFNMYPVIKNKGSAIFIHVAKKNYKSTEGCVAIKKVELLKLIKIIKKNTKINIL
jgi:L,D-peptidoglycan transpeptidase YkuD (ErfK/YbiS/YcfS/YnhG family)|tara:strand:- start:43 stop:534 length:492 start_codon:yes stop_codon:yes gene_type:complete